MSLWKCPIICRASVASVALADFGSQFAWMLKSVRLVVAINPLIVFLFHLMTYSANGPGLGSIVESEWFTGDHTSWRGGSDC